MTIKQTRNRSHRTVSHRDTSHMNSIGMLKVILLVHIIVLTWTHFAFAQIAIDGRYWKYNGQRVLLLGGWNHGHNPFIDHDTDNDKDKQGVSTPEQIKNAMDLLAAAGGNYLRCVLDPGMASAIQGFDFCAKSGVRYDLNKMTGPFWERIEDIYRRSEKTGYHRPDRSLGPIRFDRRQLGLLA